MTNANLWIGIAFLAVMLACCGRCYSIGADAMERVTRKAANRRSSPARGAIVFVLASACAATVRGKHRCFKRELSRVSSLNKAT